MPTNTPNQTSTDTSYTIPVENTDIISMENLSKAVTREVKRLQLSIIDEMYDALVNDFNYKSIDYLPQQDAELVNETRRQKTLYMSQFSKIFNAINIKLNYGNPQSDSYNLAEYLKLFVVSYNNAGKPILKLNIDIPAYNLTNLKIKQIKR